MIRLKILTQRKSYQAAMLPSNPLLTPAQVIWIREAEFMLWVIMSRQIRQDCRAFEDREVVAVVINDCRDAAVGREFREPGLLLDVLHDVDALVDILLTIGGFQFLEDDGGFVAIGCAECEELNARFANQAGWSF